MFRIIMYFIKPEIRNDVTLRCGRKKTHVCSCQFYVSYVIVQVNVYDARPAVASSLNVHTTSCIELNEKPTNDQLNLRYGVCF